MILKSIIILLCLVGNSIIGKDKKEWFYCNGYGTNFIFTNNKVVTILCNTGIATEKKKIKKLVLEVKDKDLKFFKELKKAEIRFKIIKSEKEVIILIKENNNMEEEQIDNLKNEEKLFCSLN